MEIVEIKQACKTCQDASKVRKSNIYCRLFGIMIHADYAGCKHWQRKGGADAKVEKPA